MRSLLLEIAVREMQHGLIDATLGGGLLKKRIARAGGGKRGGYRTLVAADLAERWARRSSTGWSTTES
jgi:hypothetical protein